MMSYDLVRDDEGETVVVVADVKADWPVLGGNEYRNVCVELEDGLRLYGKRITDHGTLASFDSGKYLEAVSLEQPDRIVSIPTRLIRLIHLIRLDV